jgi:hypothetical protein
VTTAPRPRAKDEQEDLERLRIQLLRADAWAKYVGADAQAWAPQRGSDLAADNQLSKPFQTSHSVVRAIAVAIDHFNGLRLMILGSDGNPTTLHLCTHAPLTLLRAAMENAATAIWMLVPNESHERVRRTLALAARDIRPSEQIKRLVGTTGPRNRDQRLSRIHAVAAQAGLVPTDLPEARYEAIVRVAGAHTGITPDVAEALWRACSAASHGDLWLIASVLERDRRRGNDVAVVELEANAEVLAFTTTWCAALIELAIRRFGELRSRR